MHTAVSRLAALEAHGAFLHAVSGYNTTLVKLIFCALSAVELVCTGVLVLPVLEHVKRVPRLACAFLVAAAFLEAVFNVIAHDTNATTTSALLMAACVVRFLEVSSSRSMSTFHGHLGFDSVFDECLGRLRDAATRYRAAALCTLGILLTTLYTLYTTDSFRWSTSTLRRSLATASWQKSASFVALLAAVGSCDTSRRLTVGQRRRKGL